MTESIETIDIRSFISIVYPVFKIRLKIFRKSFIEDRYFDNEP